MEARLDSTCRNSAFVQSRVMRMLILAAITMLQPGTPENESGGATMPTYEERRIESWRLRIDPRARTFGVVWADTGVIELSAGAPDGPVEWVIRDNGGVLHAELRTPFCSIFASQTNYPGVEPENVLSAFQWERLGRCDLGEHEDDLVQWRSELPAALEAMMSEARRIYGNDLRRCAEPRPAPGERPPVRHHPYCGFPPPAIGENHADIVS
jgi:hypothetical protein